MKSAAHALLLIFLPVCGASAQDAEPARDVRFRIEGNEAASGFELERVLGALRVDLERDGVYQGAAEDAAYELERYYRDRGYLEVKVSPSGDPVENPDTQQVEITLRIEEGVQSVLGELVVEGNEHFDVTELEPCFSWLKTGWIGFRESVFTQHALDSGLDCVRRRYQYEGFLFVEITAEVTSPAAGTHDVRVTVVEGPRFSITEKPALIGVSSFPETMLREALELVPPTVYTPRLPIVLRGRIVDFYRQHGHPFVEVRTHRAVHHQSGTVTLKFTVTEGPRATVRGIQLTGNEKTRDWVLKNRVRLRPGDLYNAALVRESFGSLLRAGLFKSVNITTDRVEGAPEEVDLGVEVKERSRYHADVLAGWGSYELIRGGAALENSNLLGTGHLLRLEGNASVRGEGVGLRYVNPYVFTEELSHHVKAFSARREHPSFEETRLGGETGLSYRVTENVRTGLTYRLRQSEARDVEDDVPPELIDNVFLSTVELSTLFDYRDNPLNPRSGWTSRLSVEYSGEALGSELHFLRPRASLSLVLPFGPLRLVAGARLGVIVPLRSTNVIPIQERFFLGGESSIRSFGEDEAGPLDNNEPIGGEAFTVYNLELRFPLVGKLHGALFGDTGTLTRRYEDVGGGRYFYSTGVGLRYLTPVGPLRVDVAANPDRQGRENLVEVHVVLGYPF